MPLFFALLVDKNRSFCYDVYVEKINIHNTAKLVTIPTYLKIQMMFKKFTTMLNSQKDGMNKGVATNCVG